MSATEISSFYSSLGIRVHKGQFKQADAALDRIYASMLKLKGEFSKSIAINPKVQFNSLQFQRSIQKSLNQVAKLTTFNLDRFNVDASRLTSSLESAIRRAQYSAGSIRIKGIVERSTVSQSARQVAHQSAGGTAAGGYAGTGGVGGLVGAGRAGIAGLAAYSGYEAIQGLQNQMDQIQQNVSKYEQQRLQLGASVGGSAQRRQHNVEALNNIANYTGTRSEDQIAGYTKFQKQAMQSGMGARQAIDLYTDMAVSTRGNGGDQQSIERQAYALQQVLGLGFLRNEELNQQLADSNPAIKKYIQKAYLDRVGFKGNDSQATEKFTKDLSKRLVLVQDVLKGYDLSARNAAPRVEELANSVEGAANRLDNVQWMENIRRSEGPLTDAVRRRIAAEEALYKASIPLQDKFIELVKIPFVEKMTEFTNGLTGLVSWIDKFQKTPDDQKAKLAVDTAKKIAPKAADYYVENHPGIKGLEWLYGTHPVLKFAKDTVGSLYDRVMGPSWGDAGNRWTPDFLARYQRLNYSYGSAYNDFQMPSALPYTNPVQFGSTPASEAMNQVLSQSYNSNNTISNDNSIIISPGAIVIEGSNLSAEDMSRELESQIYDITRRVQQNDYANGMINYPATGR
ncbi:MULTISPECIES: tape measure protein [unclassified Pseudomonas]|uniref:tape measure protein n=1 Tax=unclassified Pseudomonas TaxID=196821 RepID=UPI0023615B3A|nr:MULTISPECIES: tape measure protein [unclassified Pseudomonas]